MKKLPFGVLASSIFFAVLITAADSFFANPILVHAAGNPCSVMAQCPATPQSNARSVYRYTGADVYERLDDSGGASIFTSKPDCKLPAGQCLVTVRDQDGNTVRTYLSKSLDAGAPQQSPIPQQDTKSFGSYTPMSPDELRIGSAEPQTTYLYSPTRMYGEFYESYTDYGSQTTPGHVPHAQAPDYYRELYTEFVQPTPETIYIEPRRRAEVISVDTLASESVSLEPHDNPQDRSGHVTTGRNTVVTFVDPNSAPDVRTGEVVEKSMTDAEGNSDSDVNSFANGIEKRYMESGDVREVPEIADDSWVRDSHTPAIRGEVRGNIGLVSEDLTYLKQLEKHDLCTAECLGEVVFRENELRILKALDDQMTHGYAQIISLESGARNLWGNPEVAGGTLYLIVLQDARGETFYCGAGGICTPSDMFLPAAPRRNPIALAAAPVEVERAASRLRYEGGPVSYAFAEIVGSSANALQQIISPSPAFATRPGYPACSLMTSLIGACSNWQ